eukprot:scaffold24499_cov109-Isochrysis_galbana.AAC.3
MGMSARTAYRMPICVALRFTRPSGLAPARGVATDRARAHAPAVSFYAMSMRCPACRRRCWGARAAQKNWPPENLLAFSQT